MTTTTSASATRCFISYVRDDNTDFDDVVDRLKSNLSGRFHAATGRRLDIFVDRDSIGWGEDWRQKIRESVQSATLFIPVVTMRFFASEACREELLTFYSNARTLGVTQLILPVVLTGASQISADDSREEVRLIESLNYKNIEEAWAAGYDSAEWRRAVLDMVDGLDRAIATAEAALAAQEADTAALMTRTNSSTTSATDEEAEGDVLALGEDFADLKEMTNTLVASMSDFAEIAGSSFSDIDFAALSPQQARARLITASGPVKIAAEVFRSAAVAFESKVNAVDAELRTILEGLRSIDHPEARAQADALVTTFSQSDVITEFLGQLDEISAVLHYASMINVSVRRAVEPGLRGMQATRSAMAVIDGWNRLS